MTPKELLPRIAIILVFLTGAVFAFIESAYLRDHAASLGEKGMGIATWMWVYRILAFAMIMGASFIVGGFFRR